jgi:hypothetical protein
VTNLVQQFIGFVVVRRFRQLAQYAVLVLGAGLVLSLIHAAAYPSSSLFTSEDSARAEQAFAINLFDEPAWRAWGRVNLLLRTLFLYTVIAPQPYVFLDEVGGTFPRFNFFRIAPGEFAFSSYEGIGNVLALLWAAICLIALGRFLAQTIRTRAVGLPAAFLLCLGFNLSLHLFYGYEPFLYSPNWAYALVFFIAFAFRDVAQNRWADLCLFAFLLLLGWNQMQFLRIVIQTVNPYLR